MTKPIPTDAAQSAVGQEPTNAERATRCSQFLETYADHDAEPNLIDLLADARHWCDLYNQNFAELDRIAYRHYAAEVIAERKRPK